MKFNGTVIIAIVPYLLISCNVLTGEEIGRIHVEGISSEGNFDWKATEVDLEAGDKVRLWSEMDMAYEGEIALLFQVQLVKGLDTLGYIKFDPLEKDIAIGEIKTSVGNKTKWKFSGSSEYWEVEESSHYLLRGILVSNGNESLQLNKSDIVLKK